MLDVLSAVLPMVVVAVIFIAIARTALRATDGARREPDDTRPATPQPPDPPLPQRRPEDPRPEQTGEPDPR